MTTLPAILERIEQVLARTEGHTPGHWEAFYKRKYDEHHVSVPVAGSHLALPLFPHGVPTGRPEADARLIGHAPELRELARCAANVIGAQAAQLTVTAADLAASQREVQRLRGVLAQRGAVDMRSGVDRPDRSDPPAGATPEPGQTHPTQETP
ncbi:hypothetical protein [Deinococcus soli (ex Cha et al. 2016)]|uniref:Uncharacterized protein n=2 Tax=Deinococcus soli (ex Cha et al. 2016) TaxID=1309411 RepID=A0AAE4BML0_9DEIO|nr:hypothetical protein [Deinococcus soli (ex Cha et al. 2016)]MDR6218602.1 hypothetical protein [Deinococcus soli (ex Cha et al. 2016)]MDR6328399.1 hypothetical protein [Deinococcus soli (ex Cha et al. 2016)]MDR6753010.1 hypothetical protein [Deinococcus soli (ex Cha et al. 2016)]